MGHNSVKNVNRLEFFTETFLGKFLVKWILKIPPHPAYVATLPCETLMSAKHAINDELQGNVRSYIFKVWWVVNNQKRKVYAESASEYFYIGEYLEKLRARTW